VLSPNDVRTEEIWLRRAILPPTAIEPPAAAGKPASDVTATMPSRQRRPTMATKIALLGHHRGSHA
jgi:hypothetical protein